MRILTWNIRHGAGPRTEAVLESLRPHEPDVVVLTEFRNNNYGLRIRQGLKSLGLQHQTSSHTEPSVNAVLIASRNPLNEQTFPELKDNSHRCVMANLENLTLFGLYFPQKQQKEPLFEFLVNLNPMHVSNPTLLLGDFNTGKHYIDEIGATFHCSKYFDKLEAQGWIDAWRHFHSDIREFSWKSAAGNGFRLDHAFASQSLLAKITRAEYCHSARESGASDHSVLLLEIG